MQFLLEITHIVSTFLIIIIRSAIFSLLAAPLVVIATRVVTGYRPSWRKIYSPTLLAFITGNVLASAILIAIIEIPGRTISTYDLIKRLLILNGFYLYRLPGNPLRLVPVVLAAVLLVIAFMFSKAIKYPDGTGVGFTKGFLIVLISSLFFALLAAILGALIFLAIAR
ncbi:MAG: hypothetical protein ACMUIU_13285 [bacterium]